MYLFHVIHPIGTFIYIINEDNLFSATKIIKMMAGDKSDILEISKSEAQYFINTNRFPVLFG
jgi:hypothetical protein